MRKRTLVVFCEVFGFDNIDGNSINFDANHAYFIVIYEDETDTNKPKIAIIDMIP